MKEKDFPKEGKLKFKSLIDVKEIKTLLEGSGSPAKSKPAASKGDTPNATTAATSRNTQSPTRRPTKRDDSLDARHRKSQAPASLRKPSVAKASLLPAPQVVRGAKGFKSKSQ